MIWLDAHLSPSVAQWISEELGEPAQALRDLGLRDSEDGEIFDRARKENVILMTKDKDFSEFLTRHGPPPQVIWLRCGNTSEARLKQILRQNLKNVLQMLASGDDLVELR